jgi:hypothetical protein
LPKVERLIELLGWDRSDAGELALHFVGVVAVVVVVEKQKKTADYVYDYDRDYERSTVKPV